MCDSCNALIINGVYCHEIGCPDSWKSYKRECLWCGCEFIPERKTQEHCSQGCYNDYSGWPEYELDDLDLLPEEEN